MATAIIRIIIKVDRGVMPAVGVTKGLVSSEILIVTHPNANFAQEINERLGVAAAMLNAASIDISESAYKFKFEGIDIDEIHPEEVKKLGSIWETIRSEYGSADIGIEVPNVAVPQLSALSFGADNKRVGEKKMTFDPAMEKQIAGMVKTVVKHITEKGANPDFVVSKTDALKKVYNYIKSTTANQTVKDDIAEEVRKRVIPLITRE